jgi:hypothetical protein
LIFSGFSFGALTTTIKPRGFVGTPSGVLRNA